MVARGMRPEESGRGTEGSPPRSARVPLDPLFRSKSQGFRQPRQADEGVGPHRVRRDPSGAGAGATTARAPAPLPTRRTATVGRAGGRGCGGSWRYAVRRYVWNGTLGTALSG